MICGLRAPKQGETPGGSPADSSHSDERGSAPLGGRNPCHSHPATARTVGRPMKDELVATNTLFGRVSVAKLLRNLIVPLVAVDSAPSSPSSLHCCAASVSVLRS